MQFLEPVLGVAPLTVEAVDRFRVVGEVGHHEARVVLGVAAGVPHHLGLDDDAPFAVPPLGGVAGLHVEMRCPAGGFRERPGLAHQHCIVLRREAQEEPWGAGDSGSLRIRLIFP
jgi:hypothetical protein